MNEFKIQDNEKMKIFNTIKFEDFARNEKRNIRKYIRDEYAKSYACNGLVESEANMFDKFKLSPVAINSANYTISVKDDCKVGYEMCWVQYALSLIGDPSLLKVAPTGGCSETYNCFMIDWCIVFETELPMNNEHFTEIARNKFIKFCKYIETQQIALNEDVIRFNEALIGVIEEDSKLMKRQLEILYGK